MRLFNDMKIQLKNKVTSDTGASITFALLIFLICAIVSSVVLTATTASTGRMSQVSEVDQRYYSVGSAAGLLKKLMDGKTASIITVTRSDSTDDKADVYITTNSINDINDQKLSSDSAYIQVKDEDGEITQSSFNSLPLDTIYRLFNYDSSYSSTPRCFDLTLEDGANTMDSLKVRIEERMDQEGDIILTICSNDENPYKAKLIFKADKQRTTRSRTINNGASPITVNTIIDTVTWRFSGIKAG